MYAMKVVKYAAIGRITLKNHLAYVMDFLIRTIFLLIILYIFIQLWGVAFHGEGTASIAGYSYEQIIWYLIFAEALTMAFPSLAAKVEEEVKSGDVGYRLSRPVSYVGFHYASYIGEVAFRLLVNILVGGMLGIAVFGIPYFGWGWLGFIIIALGAMTVNFLLNMIVALCAFWVEETRGLEFVYHKLLFTIGGMLMPIEIFPVWLQKICVWLPFQAVLYFSAKTAVDFDVLMWVRMIGIQLIWIVLLTFFVVWMYDRGVRKLNVNGG
jgi:ABC-2 type transport system permease protein